MSFNKIADIDIISLSDKDYLSFISKKNKIHEEIKDYVIDRYTTKIYEQNKEIQKLRKKLEEAIKASLFILKKCLITKIKFQDNNEQNYNNKGHNYSNSFKNFNNFEKQTSYNKKMHKNNAKSFASQNKINLKKFLKPKLFQNEIKNSIDKNKNNLKYYESLENSSKNTYRNNSRHFFYKDLTFITDKHYNTFFIENNNKIDPINHNTINNTINKNSLDKKYGLKKIILKENRKNKASHSNSIFVVNNLESGNNINIGISNKNKVNKTINYNLLKNNNDNNINKKNIKKNLNYFKKLHLSNIIINNNHNINNNILEYCNTEKANKNNGKIKDVYMVKKNIFSSSQNNNNNTNHNNSVPKNNKIGKNKLNKIILKMKEINKNSYPIDYQNINQKTAKIRKKINISDINKINSINYISMTDRFLENSNDDELKKNNNNIYNNKNIKKNSKNKKKVNSININEDNYNNYFRNENSFQAIYNPTFTSFLNRKIKDNND